jgi:hypothetical protein
MRAATADCPSAPVGSGSSRRGWRLGMLAFFLGLLLASTLSCGRKGDPIAPEDVPKPAKQSSLSGQTSGPE